MSNHGGKRKGAGPKTKTSKGLKKHKRLTVTIPAELHERLMIAYDGDVFSHFISDVLEAGLDVIRY